MTFQELNHILLNDEPSCDLRKRKEELFELIPELAKTDHFDQKTIWHTKDVFEHTLMVVDGVSRDLRLRIAALFHDVGKPEVMTVDEQGEGHFYGHWEVSEDIFLKYQDQFGLKEEDIYLVRNLIYYHDLSMNSKTLSTFLREFSREDMNLMFSLKKSDALAHNPIFWEERMQKIQDAKNLYSAAIYQEQRNTSYSCERKIKEERDLLLSFFCNHVDKLVYKVRIPLDDEFLVGIYYHDKFNTYMVSSHYWDYFHVPEYSWNDIACSCRMEDSFENLKEYIEGKEESLDGRCYQFNGKNK